MKFKSIAEAFNYYRTQSVETMEQRAAEIGKIIDTDENADIDALNIELQGIKEARENAETRGAAESTLKVLSGMNMQTEKRSFGADVYDAPEYRSAFFKHLLGQKLSEVEQRAFDAGVERRGTDAFIDSTDAAAVIPTQTLNEVIKKARTMGGLLGECRHFSMPSKIAVPVGTPGTKASWHTEGAVVNTEENVPTKVVFDGYEIVKIFSISNKAKTMSISAFESYLVDELTACVMECIEDAVVNGSGSGEGSGLETITWVETAGSTQNAVEVAYGSDITYDDVITTMALLKRGYSNGAKWACNNKTLYTVFYALTDANGRPLLVEDPKSDNIGKVLGHEIIVDDNIADDVIYLGNFSKYFGYNLPQGITIAKSEQSAFRSNLIDYRATAIADCKPLVADAFVKLYIAQS